MLLAKELLLVAGSEGLVDCYFKFNSTMEPYEDWLGSVEVIPCGYRPKTQKEIQEEQLYSEANEVSRELKYNPCVTEVHKLLQRGKTKEQILEFYKEDFK